LDGLRQIAKQHGSRLRWLVGRHLTQAWVAWEIGEDQWFADGPVVLEFDREQLEVNHQKFDDLSITWNSVDVNQSPAWPTSDDFQLTWRSDVPTELAALCGQRLRAVELLEWAGGDLANGCLALGLVFSNDWLTIYNALDENALAFGPPEGSRSTGGIAWPVIHTSAEPEGSRHDRALGGRRVCHLVLFPRPRHGSRGSCFGARPCRLKICLARLR
jgi:hypothetical protein